MSDKTRKFFNRLIKISAATIGTIALSVLSTGLIIAREIPDSFSIVEGEKLSFNNKFPIKAELTGSKYVLANNISKAGKHYSDELMFLGSVPIKNIKVSVVKQVSVVPSGETFGVKFYTAGVVVVGMTDVDTAEGAKNPAYEAGIRKGDVILAINGKSVTSNSEVSALFSASNGKSITVSLKRGNVGFSVTFKPALSVSTNSYKAGLWVRDSTAGIGTITYYNPSNYSFAGLGHGICDVDTGKIMPLLTGDVVKVNMTGIVKGTSGQPGELLGVLSDTVWGNLCMNNKTGVYGFLNSVNVGKLVPVAMKQEVTEGPAEIIATIDNSGPKKYSVEIEKIHFNDDSPTKNMIIKVTDKNLLKATGGIVQGMSGCPIIQKGRLVGAVTHVFVNDPQRGYGIFAENMINSSKVLEKSQQKDVS
ncbi:stage IV sporulation protein B [[Clostridium] cellulosi]|uniref:Stage IV sporulation protein B n=1 Tax=[Clostridium] cellulosi TaxID=29343 RepID=A0A078KNN6_9FIRM|nr:stage IV sporulation protein B [[Clostridium] cellulosi]